jgi:hypothetical protein
MRYRARVYYKTSAQCIGGVEGGATNTPVKNYAFSGEHELYGRDTRTNDIRLSMVSAIVADHEALR